MIPIDGPFSSPSATAGWADDGELNARFRPVFARIGAGAVAREQKRELPFAEVNELRALGFGALRVPREYGGLGASLPQLFRLLVELAEADPNLTQIFRAHSAFVEGRLTGGDEDLRRRWFDRFVKGELVGAAMAERSDSTTNSVTLTREEDHWRLDGEKFYCTGTLFADWIAAAAMNGKDRYSVVVSTRAPGVSLEDDWDGFGQRLTASGTTRFSSVRVEDENIIHRFGASEPRIQSYITAYYQLFHLAALAGIARAVLRDGVAFVRGRTRAFGVPGKSSPRHDPLVQGVVGRLSSLGFAAQSLVDTVAQSLERAFHHKLAVEQDDPQPQDVPAVPETTESTAVESAGSAESVASVPSAPTADDPLTEPGDVFAAADIQAFQAQQVIINLVLEATTLLFEVGGASAASGARSLDRHWRNARTLASHNPAVFRARALGDFYLNGTTPAEAWQARQQQALSDA